MATVNYVVNISVKHRKIMMLVNLPFVLLGFKPPFVKWFISVSDPKAVEV